jgi:hypothetical protein
MPGTAPGGFWPPCGAGWAGGGLGLRRSPRHRTGSGLREGPHRRRMERLVGRPVEHAVRAELRPVRVLGVVPVLEARQRRSEARCGGSRVVGRCAAVVGRIGRSAVGARPESQHHLCLDRDTWIHGRIRQRARNRDGRSAGRGARAARGKHRARRPLFGNPELISRKEALEVVAVVGDRDMRVGGLQLAPPLGPYGLGTAARGDADRRVVLLDDVEAACGARVRPLRLLACRDHVHPPGRDAPDRFSIAVAGVRGEQIGRALGLAGELLRDPEGRFAGLGVVGARCRVDAGGVAHRGAVASHRTQQACIELAKRRQPHQEGLELPSMKGDEPDVQARPGPLCGRRCGVIILGPLVGHRLCGGGCCSGDRRR